MNLWFFILTFVITISLIMIIFSNNAVHSVFWFVLIYFNSFLYLLTLGQEYIGLTLIIIYVGAITIVFLFVIMMLDILELKSWSSYSGEMFPLITLIMLNFFYQLFFWWGFSIKDFNSWELEEFNNLSTLGSMLYTDYYILFIFVTFLLVIGLIGVIVLCLEISTLSIKQGLGAQQKRNNSWV